MVTALFRETGAYFGDDIMPPTIANPFGYYECHKINQLNNLIIQKILRKEMPKKIRKILRHFLPPIHLDPRCSMLAAPKNINLFDLPDEMINDMRHFTSNSPFCLKDPRFSITLPFWKAVIPHKTRYLVVFRDPRRTVDSMLRNAKEIYNPPLPLDEEWGFKLWHRNYRRLLHEISDEKDWFFIHDELIFNSKIFPALENFVEAKLNTDQVKPEIRRSRPNQFESFSKNHQLCNLLFEELKERSQYDLANWLP